MCGILLVLVAAVEVASHAPLYGSAAWKFHRCGRLLLDAGHGREVCEAAIRAASHEELPGDNVWSLLEDCATNCPGELWQAFEPLLTARDPRADRLLVRLAWHDVGSKLPSEQVMAWIGTDPCRAVEMAHIMRFTSEDLPALARALLARFGAESAVGRELTANVGSDLAAVQPGPPRGRPPFSRRLAGDRARGTRPRGRPSWRTGSAPISTIDSPWRPYFIKACDRLDNLRSLGQSPVEFRKKQVTETRDKYFRLFDRMVHLTPEDYRDGIRRLCDEIYQTTDAVPLS